MLEVPLNSIKFSKNYRQTFPEKSLKELAQSIKQHGVIEPLVVRRRGDGYFSTWEGIKRTSNLSSFAYSSLPKSEMSG